MEREYNQNNKSEERYQSHKDFLSEEDKMMSEVYLLLVRIIPAYQSWDYQ